MKVILKGFFYLKGLDTELKNNIKIMMAITTTISKACELPSSLSRSFFSLNYSLYFLCISSFFLSILLDPFQNKVKPSNSEIFYSFF
ncbi:hypothetical protein B4143_0985 [Bacillus subtilis]|nr:hypothetical protein B4143_0985 [Bacillus subtilis]